MVQLVSSKSVIFSNSLSSWSPAHYCPACPSLQGTHRAEPYLSCVILVILVNMVDIIPSSQLVIGNGAFSIVYRARLKIVSIRSNRRILTTLHTLKRETEMLQGPDSWCSGLCNWKYFRSDEFKRCLTNWLSTSTPTALELTTYKS